jgi:DNA primase
MNIYHQQIQPSIKKYLLERGITQESIDFFEIGEALDFQKELQNIKNYQNLPRVEKNGKTYPFFTERITFPIHTQNGGVKGYTGREIKSSNGKYPKYLKSKTLTHLDIWGFKTITKKTKTVIVTEGIKDGILLYQEFGGEKVGVIAPLGSYFSEEAIRMLLRVGVENFIIVGDNDKAGRKFNWESAKKLLAVGKVPSIGLFSSEFKDIEDLFLSKKEIRPYLRSVDIYEYIIDLLNNIKNPTAREKFYQKTLKTLDFRLVKLETLLNNRVYFKGKEREILKKYKYLESRIFCEDLKIRISNQELKVLGTSPIFKFILSSKRGYLIQEEGKINYSNRNLTQKEEDEIFFFLLKLKQIEETL